MASDLEGNQAGDFTDMKKLQAGEWSPAQHDAEGRADQCGGHGIRSVRGE